MPELTRMTAPHAALHRAAAGDATIPTGVDLAASDEEAPMPQPNRQWRCAVEDCPLEGKWQGYDVPEGQTAEAAGRRMAHMHYLAAHYQAPDLKAATKPAGRRAA